MLKNPFLIADTGFDAGALTGAERVEGAGAGRGRGLDDLIAATGSFNMNARIEVYMSTQRARDLT